MPAYPGVRGRVEQAQAAAERAIVAIEMDLQIGDLSEDGLGVAVSLNRPVIVGRAEYPLADQNDQAQHELRDIVHEQQEGEGVRIHPVPWPPGGQGHPGAEHDEHPIQGRHRSHPAGQRGGDGVVESEALGGQCHRAAVRTVRAAVPVHRQSPSPVPVRHRALYLPPAGGVARVDPERTQSRLER